jgi:hypothetical protein
LTFNSGIAKLKKTYDEEAFMTKLYKLILQSGPTAGTEFVLENPEIFLGRDVNNDITINDPEVSRRHARLIRQGENYIYEDLGSTNGSFILNQRLTTPVLLTPGTTITIGERVVIYYVVNAFDPSATVASPGVSSASKPILPPVPPIPPAVPPTPAYIPSAYIPPAYIPPVPSYPPPPPSKTAPSPQAAHAPKPAKGLVILLIILGVILVFCVIPWIIVEVTNSYCSLFPGIFNAIQAGVCP